jgi:hypothetical protein
MANHHLDSGAIFDQFAESTSNVLPLATGSVPERLYHFTDANGMAGIIRWGKLWSTLITGLNDRSELRYGVDVLRAMLSKAGSRATGRSCRS